MGFAWAGTAKPRALPWEASTEKSWLLENMEILE